MYFPRTCSHTFFCRSDMEPNGTTKTLFLALNLAKSSPSALSCDPTLELELLSGTSIALSWCNVFIKSVVFVCHPIYCITCDWLYFYEYITSSACYVGSPNCVSSIYSVDVGSYSWGNFSKQSKELVTRQIFKMASENLMNGSLMLLTSWIKFRDFLNSFANTSPNRSIRKVRPGRPMQINLNLKILKYSKINLSIVGKYLGAQMS
jgi:hypothetical protein